MSKILALIVAVLLIATASIATAASPQDVQKFIKTMHNNRNKLLKFHRLKNGVYEGVYVIKKKRYTVTIADNHIFFYIRPNGTYGDRYVEMVGGSNGKVNWGAKGTESTDLTFAPYANHGMEHEKHWQTVYDEAIAAAIAHYN